MSRAWHCSAGGADGVRQLPPCCPSPRKSPLLLGLPSSWGESSIFRCCVSVQTLRKNGKKTLSVQAAQPPQFISFLLLKVGKEDKDGCALARGPTEGQREELNPGLICSAWGESWGTRMSKAIISFSSWLSKRQESRWRLTE